MKIKDIISIFFFSVTTLIIIIFNERIFSIIENEKMKNAFFLILGGMTVCYLFSFLINSQDLKETIIKIGYIYLMFIFFFTLFYLNDFTNFNQYLKTKFYSSTTNLYIRHFSDDSHRHETLNPIQSPDEDEKMTQISEESSNNSGEK